MKIPGSTKENGWLVNLEQGWGNYGTNYSLRAAAAFSALGAVLPQDDTYFVVGGDAKRNNYTITFPEDQTPPTNAAWGIDMYNTKLHLVSNPINRYAIGPHLAPVSYNSDGSLTVYVQNTGTQLRRPATELAPGSRRRIHRCHARLLAERTGTERHLVSAGPGEGKLKPIPKLSPQSLAPAR